MPLPMLMAGCSFVPRRTLSGSIKRHLSLTTIAQATTTTPDLLSTLNPTPGRVPLNKSARPIRGQLSNKPLAPRHSKPTRRPHVPEAREGKWPTPAVVVPVPLDKYFLHVHASSNNTLLHLMDAKGNCQPRGQISAGLLKYRHKQRSTFDAGFKVTLQMIKRIEEEADKKRETEIDEPVSEDGEMKEAGRRKLPAMEIEVVFNGFGQGKQAFFAAMMSSEGNKIRPLVTRFTDRTHIKIGGERSPKARRL